MDTIPFNLIMLAVDIVLLVAFFVWCNKITWISGAILNLCSIYFVAHIFPRRTAQVYVEGLCFHFGPFLIIAGLILIWVSLHGKRKKFLKRHESYISDLSGPGEIPMSHSSYEALYQDENPDPQRERPAKKHFITAGISLFGGTVLLLLGLDCLVYEPYALTVEHYEIRSSKVHKPLRIVFVADTQTDKISDYERRTFELMKKQDGDLVILGGDYIQIYSSGTPQADATMLERLREQFRGALEAAKFDPPLGAFAIRGNNESVEDFKTLFAETGFEAIPQTTTRDLGPIMLTILSMEESGMGPYGNWQRPKVFLQGEEQKAKFHLMVGHIPAFALAETDADLLLAGHTHGGGQVYIPFYGPIMAGTRDEFPLAWTRGRTDLPNGSVLIVSRGTGMERGWAPEIRFLCKPEISVIDILPERR